MDDKIEHPCTTCGEIVRFIPGPDWHAKALEVLQCMNCMKQDEIFEALDDLVVSILTRPDDLLADYERRRRFIRPVIEALQVAYGR